MRAQYGRRRSRDDGLVVILCAPHSRTPKTLRAMGIVMCMQALSATLLGPGSRANARRS
jgi:hypothetical protein